MNFTLPWTSKPPANGWTAPIEDVKQQIGQHVDHLAKVAAQVGHDVASQAAQVTQDAGSQAASVARDIGGQAVKATQSAGSQAAGVAKDIPTGASTLAQQALRGASQLGKELRAIRVTREPAPAQRGPDVMPGIALLAGVGGGLALMFFFDPEQGRRRRALLRDQFTKWTRVSQQAATGKAKDLRNRTTGLAHEARKAVTGAGASESGEETFDSSAPSGYANGSNGNSGQAIPIESDQPITSEIR